MTTPHDARRRILALGSLWPRPVCATCRGRPHRLVRIDPDTGEELAENMPVGGCLACDQPVYREYRLVGLVAT